MDRDGKIKFIKSVLGRAVVNSEEDIRIANSDLEDLIFQYRSAEIEYAVDEIEGLEPTREVIVLFQRQIGRQREKIAELEAKKESLLKVSEKMMSDDSYLDVLYERFQI